MADTENTLENTLGWSFSAWLPPEIPWDMDLPSADGEIAPCCVVNLDQCPLNVCMANFLDNHEHATFWWKWGRFHRRFNDFETALAQSGLLGVPWYATRFPAYTRCLAPSSPEHARAQRTRVRGTNGLGHRNGFVSKYARSPRNGPHTNVYNDCDYLRLLHYTCLLRTATWGKSQMDIWLSGR